MEVRKLDISEHGQSRRLWEQVFAEDTREFLDYYYYFKTRDNVIYVLEEDDAIRSMLQLNPYTVQVGTEQFIGHYIVGVATEEEYRKRGYMGDLLRKSMQDMYVCKEPFTFLMPAAEAIYTPYDFRFVYKQKIQRYVFETNMNQSIGSVSEENQSEVVVSEAGIGDGAALADFFNRYFAEQFQIYAVRDENYYRTMLFEQQSENGGIRLLKKEGKLVGAFLYGDEEGLEIREPFYLKENEQEFWNAVRQLCVERNQTGTFVYAGINRGSGVLQSLKEETKKPMVMFRIIHLESLLGLLRTREREQIDCSFAVLDSILPQNSRIWKLQSESGAQSEVLDNVYGKILVRETEDSEGVLSIAALTSLLFGYKSVEEIAEEPDVFLTEHLKGELKKIQPLQQIFLNEIV